MAGNICVETKRLYFATGISNVESAKLLLAAKASVDIKNDDGWEPQPMSQPLDKVRLRNCLGLRN